MAGLSLRELSALLNSQVTYEALRNYENGRQPKDNTIVLALAQALNVPFDFFYKPVAVQLGPLEFRKRKYVAQKEVDTLKARVQDYLERYLELEELLNSPLKVEQMPAWQPISTLSQAETCAEELRAHWNLGLNPMPNLVETLEEQGIKVFIFEQSNNLDGFATLPNAAHKVIALNKLDAQGNRLSLDRLRFTASHELGHLILPLAKGAPAEKLCNRFAGAFLLPAQQLIKEIGAKRPKLHLNELLLVKRQYGMSISALIYRCKDLNIISDSKAKALWASHQEEDWKKHERQVYAGEEKVYRFDQLLLRGVEEGLISLSKSAQLANIPIDKIKAVFDANQPYTGF